jgi:hypothetical protein
MVKAERAVTNPAFTSRKMMPMAMSTIGPKNERRRWGGG